MSRSEVPITQGRGHPRLIKKSAESQSWYGRKHGKLLCRETHMSGPGLQPLELIDGEARLHLGVVMYMYPKPVLSFVP